MLNERTSQSSNVLARRRFLGIGLSAAAAFLMRPETSFADGLDSPGFFQNYLEAVLVQGSRLPLAIGQYYVPREIPRLNAFADGKSEHALTPYPESADIEVVRNPLIVYDLPAGPHLVYDSVDYSEIVALSLDAETVARMRAAYDNRLKQSSSSEMFPVTRLPVANKVQLHQPPTGLSRINCVSGGQNIPVMYSHPLK